MSTYEEINKFLSQFKTDSYNREQIGNNKQLIIIDISQNSKHLNKISINNYTLI